MFYVNTTAKKFALPEPFQPSNSMPCGCGYCCEGTDVPLFLRTKVVPTSSIVKPYLTHYETAVFEIQFKDAQGVPYDLTDNALILAVDNTFSHSDSLVCLSSDIEITDPLNGIAKFTVKCSSQKFGKLVAVKMPSAQIWMQITAYSRDDLQGTVLLLDRGIHLQPRLYTTQGEPQPLDPNYYTKQQIDIMFLDYSNSIPLETIATKDDLRNLQQQISDSLQDIRSNFDNYYTKEEMDDTLLYYASNSRVDHQVQTLTAYIELKEDVSDALIRYAELQSLINTKESSSDAQQEHAAIKSSIKDLSDSLTALKGRTSLLELNKQDISDAQQMEFRLQNEIGILQNSIAEVADHLSNSLSAVKNTFSYYYTKEEVNGITAQLSNSIASVKSSLGNYYTKTEVDGVARALSNSITAVKDSLGNYYTKEEADNKFLTEHQSLQDYYTKEQVDTIVEGLSNSVDLSNYYTKAQVDAIVAGLSDSADLANYYTKSQTDALLSTKQDLSDALQMKASFEGQLDAFSNSIAVIKDTFSNYYTKAETDELLSEFSNSGIEDLRNRVTVLQNKPEAAVKGEGAVSVQSNSSLYTVSLNVDDNIFGIIGQLTSKLTIAKLQTPTQGFAATYQLQGADGNPIGDKINIIQDILLQDMVFIPHATAQDVLSDSSVILDDPYIKVVCYVQKDQQTALYKTVYVPVKDLVDTYTAGNGLQLVNTQFSLRIDSDSQTIKYLSLADKLGLRGIDAAISSAIQSALNSYYDKTYIDNALKDLSNSIAVVRGLFGDYYTKSQVDAVAKGLSDSIESLKSTFSNYYTKSEIDSTVASISDSIAAIKGSLEDYYTKTQVDAIAGNLSNSIEAVKNSLNDYYNKEEVDSFVKALSDSLHAVDGKFSGYYNKDYIDTLQKSLSDSIQAVKSSFENYYTKEQVEAIAGALSNSINAVRDNFANYYTKSEVDSIAEALSNSIQAVDNKFGSYYDKTQVDALIGNLSNSFNEKLQNYYNRDMVDAFIEELSNAILYTNSRFDSYYTKPEIDSFLQDISNSISSLNSRFGDYYTKQQIEALIDVPKKGTSSYMSIPSAPDNKIILQGLQVPVGIETSLGHYYPIEKGSIEIGSDSVTIDIVPYLAYDGVSSFTPNWRVWMGAGMQDPFDRILIISNSGAATLDHDLYNRWEFTGSGNISLVLTAWQDGDRGQVVVDTSKQNFSVPADWIMPDKVWDAWTEAPGVYCMQIRKEGGNVYAHAAVPFTTGQNSDAQEIPVNLSARLQYLQGRMHEVSDSLSYIEGRLTVVQAAVDAIQQNAWTTLEWASSIALSGANGARQKLTLSDDTTITAPVLSATYTELTLQISKSSSYSFTVDNVTVIAAQTTLLSWYWDGQQTRRLPNVYLGD